MTGRCRCRRASSAVRIANNLDKFFFRIEGKTANSFPEGSKALSSPAILIPRANDDSNFFHELLYIKIIYFSSPLDSLCADFSLVFLFETFLSSQFPISMEAKVKIIPPRDDF
jgi:hypothetical protein